MATSPQCANRVGGNQEWRAGLCELRVALEAASDMRTPEASVARMSKVFMLQESQSSGWCGSSQPGAVVVTTGHP